MYGKQGGDSPSRTGRPKDPRAHPRKHVVTNEATPRAHAPATPQGIPKVVEAPRERIAFIVISWGAAKPLTTLLFF